MIRLAICIPQPPDAELETCLGRLIETLQARRISGRIITAENARPLEYARAVLLWKARQEGFTHQLCIDNDVTFNPDAVITLLETGLDLVCAAYRSRNPPDERFIVAAAREPIETSLITERPHGHRTIPIAWGNLGFTIIKRAPLEHMIATCKELEFVSGEGVELSGLFQTYIAQRRYSSEDVAFYRRAAFCGIDAHCAIDVDLWHQGIHGRLGDLFPPAPG